MKFKINSFVYINLSKNKKMKKLTLNRSESTLNRQKPKPSKNLKNMVQSLALVILNRRTKGFDPESEPTRPRISPT